MQWRKGRENREARRQQRSEQLIETEGRLKGASEEKDLGTETRLQGSEHIEKKVRRKESVKRRDRKDREIRRQKRKKLMMETQKKCIKEHERKRKGAVRK